MSYQDKVSRGLKTVKKVAKEIYKNINRARKKILTAGNVIIFGIDRFARLALFGFNGGKKMIDTTIDCACGETIELNEFETHTKTNCKFILSLQTKIDKLTDVSNKSNDKISELISKKDDLFREFDEKVNLVDFMSFSDRKQVRKAITDEMKIDKLNAEIANANGKLAKFKAKFRKGLSASKFIFKLAAKVGTTIVVTYLTLLRMGV